MTGERLPCCVPFCRRTTRAGPFREWICGKHWRLVSRKTKTRRRMAERIVARADARFAVQYEAQGCTFREEQLRRCDAARGLARVSWERCKAEAIEAAMGISR